MIKLKELLDRHKLIKIIVEDEDYISFLNYAKQEGCLWRDGSVINPKTSKPSTYSKIIVLDSDYLIHHPYGWITMMSLQNKPTYLFKDFQIDKVVDDDFKKSLRTLKYDQQYEVNQKAKELAHKRKCAENRIISQLQLKYQKIANTLQKHFFVHYENDDELLRLFKLFKQFGYENIYDIENFAKDPKVICVDNENMTFYPASLNCCSVALLSRKKFHHINDLERIFTDIFS